MDKQMSMAIDLIEDKKESLHICKDNKKVSMTIEEIFDHKKYDSILAVTYSISTTFLNKYIKDFKKAEIVVGINEDKVQNSVNLFAKKLKAQIKEVLNNTSIKTYQGLDMDMKRKLAEKSFEVKVPFGVSIHSKFYLLENRESGHNRIILGSCNLSEMAFQKTTSQYENIIIYDDSELFAIYKDYYESLADILTNYFPKELMVTNKKKLENIKDTDSVIVLTNEEVEKIKKNQAIELILKVEDFKANSVIPADAIGQIKDMDEDKKALDDEKIRDSDLDNQAYKLVRESVNNRTKDPTIKKAPAIKKLVNDTVKTIKVNTDIESGERTLLFSKPETRNIGKAKSGLLVKSELTDEFIPFGEMKDIEEIRKALILLDEFIHTFESFVHKYDDKYGQRIMEAIFYAFTGPFLYEIKKLARTSEERNDIPQFLFIGGTAGSGKSSLIKMINKMLGLSDKAYYNFSELASGAQAKANRVKVIEGWAREDNVYPIIIDEFSIEFFTKANYGRDLILNTTNSQVEIVSPFPVTIGTTNADGYTLPPEARRRSYYLKIDKKFDDKYKKDSPLVYKEIYEKMNNILFTDFTIQMADRLDNSDDYEWNHFADGFGKVDFLYQTRNIFRDYYKSCGMPLPRYFPTRRYTDDFESNQEKWRKLYKRAGDKEFVFDIETGSLFFNTATIDENKGNYEKPSEIYKQALDQSVLVGTIGGLDIELDAKAFFEWIDVRNPYIEEYKKFLRDFYYNKDKKIRKENGRIVFPLDKTSKDSDIIKQSLIYMTKDTLIEESDSELYFDEEKLLRWLGIEESNILSKFLDKFK
ncbi:phospholipase D family protein [Anaerococcus sp.]|uniref:phospholipase D family protein n=1 Tax=Anaerococcus sp. TaxID=1872515 RepID=UPI0027BADE76|nr:phospholipase D family protein [Anaerococcus sp.]